jgi:hypothetical protein
MSSGERAHVPTCPGRRNVHRCFAEPGPMLVTVVWAPALQCTPSALRCVRGTMPSGRADHGVPVADATHHHAYRTTPLPA